MLYIWLQLVHTNLPESLDIKTSVGTSTLIALSTLPSPLLFNAISRASACGNAAYSYAKSKKLDNSDDWSYICCTIRKGSSCYEKIR